jgi:uncharacterized protein YeaO (DUF488 family)
MIKVKHFMDDPEHDDGTRIWIEPIGLTRDLRRWCKVDFLVPELGPPVALAAWFEQHPDGYAYFREHYHAVLYVHPDRDALRKLVDLGAKYNVTLLHQSDDPRHNSATALLEFLREAWTTAPPGA